MRRTHGQARGRCAGSPTHGDQEGTAWNGHFDGTCHHPNVLFNRFGMLERCALRHGTVHSADGWADGWKEVPDPVIARYARRDPVRFFRADAACAIPALHARLEEAGCFHAIRLPSSAVLRGKIAHRMTRPEGRPSPTKVRRLYEDFGYQPASRDTPRRVAAGIEWHPDDLLPRVGFIVTSVVMEPDRVVRFCTRRGTAGQDIGEGTYALRRTRLPCRRFHHNGVPVATARVGLQPCDIPALHRTARGHGKPVADQIAPVERTGTRSIETGLRSSGG